MFRDEVLPLFEDSGVVLTSATTASGSGGGSGVRAGERRSFAYTRRRLGLDEKLEGATETRNGEPYTDEEEVPTRRVSEFAGAEVFDYEGRVLIYTEDGKGGKMPAPTFGNADAFSRECVRRTEELVKLSRGRALVILSTNRAVSIFRETFSVPLPGPLSGRRLHRAG